MSLEYEFSIQGSGENERVDTVLTEYLKHIAAADSTLEMVFSRSKVSQWIREGCVNINSETVTKPGHRLKDSDELVLRIPPPKSTTLEPDSSVKLNIIFEDEDILVIDKPAGLVVHPGAGVVSGTLVQGILAYLGDDIRQIGDGLRPGLVHRLDKDTSGLMVIAKTDTCFQNLVSQFQPPRTISREYLALTLTAPTDATGEGEIDLPIGRHRIHRKKMAVVFDGGKAATTKWTIEEQFSLGCLLRLSLQTGRTHQIRVHLQASNAPIVGDPVYGPAINQVPTVLRGKVKSFGRQALHATSLKFSHPRSAELISFSSEPAQDMKELIDSFRHV